MNWYCIRSHQKKEHVAAQILSNELKVDAFCPRISQIKRTKLGKQRFLDAMFPCYIFARIDLRKQLQEVHSIRGVVRILKYGACYPIVPDGFLQGLRDELKDDVLYIGEPELKPMSSLCIVRGPFSGLIGRLVSADKCGERLTILMDLLGSQVSVSIRAEDAMSLDSKTA